MYETTVCIHTEYSACICLTESGNESKKLAFLESWCSLVA